MQRRICPICDHPMASGHYCSFCKQWVRNPHYVNATYYLNERHPADETNCEYHNDGGGSFEKAAKTGADTVRSLMERAKTYSQTSQTKNAGTGRQPGRQAVVQTPNRGKTVYQASKKQAVAPSGKNQKTKEKSTISIALVILLILFAMSGINYLYRIFMYFIWML